MSSRWKMTFSAGLLAAGAVVLGMPEEAHACGCFAPPSPDKPVVQAGERIVFAYEDGKVVAHIQIQYQGDAEEFAWLLPMPSVPELKVGSEELFTRIEEATQPTFQVNTTGFCGGGGPSFGCADQDVALSAPNERYEEPKPPVAVVVASAGPYDYAVLDASNKQPMLDWLDANGYFVPAINSAALDPYVNPGSYFLALKLRAGASVGDLQPVIVEYASQYPMIPLILTSVSAIPDMGVLVWVLGDHRAIPRNYQHVLINEEHIDWFNGAANYNAVLIDAVNEAQGGQAFVTEYAGSTQRMFGVLDNNGERFGERAPFETLVAQAYLARLREKGFDFAAMQPVLERHFIYPSSAQIVGVDRDAYFLNLDQFLPLYDADATIDAPALTAELWERVVEPTLAAAQLFYRHPKMTRFYTTLSPEEMTKDPVFAFNPDLPDISEQHVATVTNLCEGDLPWEMALPDGRKYYGAERTSFTERVFNVSPKFPKTVEVQILREEGQPEIVVSNASLLAEAAASEADDGGCSSSGRSRANTVFNVMLLLAVMAVGRRALKKR